MLKFRSPLVGAVIAAALASTTGYCVLTNAPDGLPPSAPATVAPTSLLPEAVIPYPLKDLPVARRVE